MNDDRYKKDGEEIPDDDFVKRIESLIENKPVEDISSFDGDEENGAEFSEDNSAEFSSGELSSEDAVSAEEGEPAASPPGASALMELYDWAQALSFSIVLIVLVFTFALRIIGVIGSSMVPTFHEGDRVVVSGFNYTPKQGDLVVVRKESFMKEPIVKRVIATAGQTVDIDFDNSEVYVNGVKLSEPYINEPTVRREDTQFPATVPEGCVFIMGDNRNKSTDSRNMLVGMVDTRYIIGRVFFKLYPLSDFGPVKSYSYN